MKTQFKNKRAFTLIELLIVIAIIGILFIVLVSKVDFATDKAKASGVQADFRAFQTAFEQVARENAGYATLGWDTGDYNGDRIRNSYDKGDKECGQSGCTECKQDGKQGPHEIWVGSKTYGETWSGIYSLVNPADSKDASAFVALENAINSNLDPKLHLTITPNADASGNLIGSAAITMANQARDPWKNEYAGSYISNATVDNLDRGSIVMYSTGANGKFGTNYAVSDGVIGVAIPGSNVDGKDDYILSVTYSYANGYGEVHTGTAGFSNTKSTLTSNPIVDNGVNAGGVSAGVGSIPEVDTESDSHFLIPGSNAVVKLPTGLSKDDVIYDAEDNSVFIPNVPNDMEAEIIDSLLSLEMGCFKPSFVLKPAVITQVPYETTTVVQKLPNKSITTYYIGRSHNSAPDNISTSEWLSFITKNLNETYKYIGVTAHCNESFVEIGQDKLHGFHADLYLADDSISLEDFVYAIAYNNNDLIQNEYLTCLNHSDDTGFVMFEWNGTEYIHLDINDEVNAITDFTETQIVTAYRNEVIEGCINPNYGYSVYGTIQYEEGMTWEEWINSSYNTISPDVSIKTKDYDDVPLTEVINANKQYGFVITFVKGKWQINDVPDLSMWEEDTFAEQVIFTDEKGRQASGIIMSSTSIGYGYGLFPMPIYRNDKDIWMEGAKLIDFGDTLQQVTPQFYEWLTNNATMIE